MWNNGVIEAAVTLENCLMDDCRAEKKDKIARCVCVCVRVCVHASMHFCFYLSMHEVSNVKNYQSVQSMSSSLQAGAKVTEGKLHL